MKVVIVFTIALLIASCSSIKLRHTATLSIPENGFQLVQHTTIEEERKDNSLYKTSRRIETLEFGSKELQSFITELRTTMHQTNGVGIAANQVNKNLQVFLIEAINNIRWHKDFGKIPYQVFINPKIIKASKEKRNFWHGCLSGRGEKLGNVATYDWIEYEAFDMQGKIITGRLDGLAAVVFQHEFRHLLGGTYLDKAVEFLDSTEVYVGANDGDIALFELVEDALPVMLDDYVIGESLEDYYQRYYKR